ncbi:MAG: zinc-dependent alcohol dehydrogenase family protein [Pseudomonadota bacterium]
MKAMILNSYGGDARFEQGELATPEVRPGHVVVRIAASSVNTVDTMIRTMGSDLPLSPALPAVLGMDFAGTIEAVGPDVQGFAAGDEVYGCAGGLLELQGALADYMVADAHLIAHKPKTISMREAAALPLVGITAYEGLTRAGTASGQKVLVHGAAGGVGHVAAQLARHMGAETFTTATGAEKMSAVREMGFPVIDYATQDVKDYVDEHTGGAGFDVVFDSVGGANMLNSFEAAALNGQVATTVSLLELDLTLAHFKGLSLHVVFMLIPMIHNVKRAEHGRILATLADLVESGAVKPLLDTPSFALSEVNEAYDRLLSGNAIGKVVVEH